jgi:AbrB family looped-hinge helix DNA binding protein
MAATVKLSSKFQVVIPRAAREAMALSAGDRLLVLVKPDRVVLMRKPRNYASRMAGLHADVWQDKGARHYLENERGDW